MESLTSSAMAHIAPPPTARSLTAAGLRSARTAANDHPTANSIGGSTPGIMNPKSGSVTR